ncbi:ANTAR domain-containing protein [Amycolatopsis speibonae]|uniref:ANTAR domain-containing protein n=1 Tax=Amycolatopsis speibonae TaxID=1450224 RepID=A0ABV7P6H4_9PSEU
MTDVTAPEAASRWPTFAPEAIDRGVKSIVDAGRAGLAEVIDLEFTEHRAQVHQATGMVSVRLAIGLADALARLRAHAYLYGRKLSEVADDVVWRRITFRTES